MIKQILALGSLIAVVGTASVLPQVAYAADSAKAAAVRPEVGKPIQAALEFLKARKVKEALGKVRDAEAVGGKSAYESYLIERVKAQALATSGDARAAGQAFESAASAAGAPAGERMALLAAAAGQYYSAKDYGKASGIAARYLKEGGTDAGVRTVYVQSLFLSGDNAGAAKILSADIRALEQDHKTPSEEQLQLLAQVYYKLNDTKAYAKSLEKLVQYYPKKDYWLSLIYSVKQQPGIGDRLALDLARLQDATGTLRTAADYENATQLALQQEYPTEAKRFLDQGFAANLLGQGADADRHRRLREMTNKNLAEDNKTLGKEDAQAVAAKDGSAAVNLGFNHVLHGEFDKGIAMMDAAIRKGGLKRPDDAKLRLGYAYHLAGKRSLAIQTLKSVSGTDGAAQLADLWVIFLARAS